MCADEDRWNLGLMKIDVNLGCNMGHHPTLLIYYHLIDFHVTGMIRLKKKQTNKCHEKILCKSDTP